jgi:tetratricopeptide (TPR) repeat protein
MQNKKNNPSSTIKTILRLIQSLLMLCVVCLADAMDAIPEPNDLALVNEPRLLKAIADAKAAVERTPTDAKAWGWLGHVYLIHSWEAEATVCYQRAAELDPTEFRWFYFLGRTTYKTKPSQAAVALAQAIALKSDYAPAHIYHAHALRSLGRFEEAKQRLELTKELDPLNPFAELWLGEIALAEKQFEAAHKHLKRALELNPEQSEAHAAMARLEMALGDRKAANVHAQAARRPTAHAEMRDLLWWEVLQAGATAALFAERGRRYMQEGEYARAIKELEPLLSAADDNPEIWRDYGVSLFHTGHDAEALSAFARVLAILRGMANSERRTDIRAESHNYIGLIYQRTGAIDEAMAHFQATIELVPGNVEFRRNLADACWSAKAYDKAATEYQKILAHDPSDAQAHYRLGLTRLTQEKYDEARSHLQEAVKLTPNHVRARSALSIVYDKLGLREEAVRELETVLQLEPENPHARKMLEQFRR